MTQPPSARRALTQDRLLDAAIAAFAEKGVAASSVEEICERAGFTRGAFYSNFDSKDELCVAVLRRKAEEVLSAATRATDAVPREPIAPDSVDGVIHTAVSIFQAGHPADPEWLVARMELRLYALRNPSVREALRTIESQLDELMTQAIWAATERVGARFAVPADRLFSLLNVQYDALTLHAAMEGADLADPAWAEPLAALLRALVIVPEEGGSGAGG